MNSSFIDLYALDLMSDTTNILSFQSNSININYVHFSFFVLKYENGMVQVSVKHN